MAARVNLPVAGVIENMSWFVAPDTGARYEVFSGGGGSALAHELGVPLLGQVPLEAAVAQAGDGGLPVVEARPDCAGGQGAAGGRGRDGGRRAAARAGLVRSRAPLVECRAWRRPLCGHAPLSTTTLEVR